MGGSCPQVPQIPEMFMRFLTRPPASLFDRIFW